MSRSGNGGPEPSPQFGPRSTEFDALTPILKRAMMQLQYPSVSPGLEFLTFLMENEPCDDFADAASRS
jgi:hypothetical protein